MSYSDTEESDVELEEEDKALQEIVHACKHGWDRNIDPCWSFPACVLLEIVLFRLINLHPLWMISLVSQAMPFAKSQRGRVWSHCGKLPSKG